MVLLESREPEIGAPMPSFRLKDVFGNEISSDDLNAKVLVIMFLCGHCPYVKAVEDRIIALGREYASSPDVQFIAICSNDWRLDPEKYAEDSPEALRKRVEEKGYPFPYLLDESQEVAKAFQAVCTPEFFVYDKERKLYYHGRLDDNWREPEKVTKQELKEAIERCLRDEPPPMPQYPSMGCSIKWRS